MTQIVWFASWVMVALGLGVPIVMADWVDSPTASATARSSATTSPSRGSWTPPTAAASTNVGANPSYVLGPPPMMGGDVGGSYGIGLDNPPLIDQALLADSDAWHWQLLPTGIIYRSYLAGPKESRFGAQVYRMSGDSTIWDATLGARVGIVRYGDNDIYFPQGLQLDAEGSAQVRLDIPEDVDVRSVDFRGGLPLTLGYGNHQTKLGFYHLSSHLADEFLLKNSDYNRLNYSKDALVLGHSIYVTPDLRLYAEAAYSFHSDVAREWEFQFGADYAPAGPTGIRGVPFAAVNGYLREELDWGGGLYLQVGWLWRADDSTHLLRTGFHYYNGESTQFSFYDRHEQQIGWGVWYDF